MARIIRLSGEYKKAKVKLEGLGITVKAKTNRRLFDIVRTGATATRNYIKTRITSNSTGNLVQSIKWKKEGTNTTTWELFQDGDMTINDDGRNYAVVVNKGFQSHYSKISGSPKLQQWIYKNLSGDKLESVLGKDKIYIGKNLNWRPAGMRFDRFAFNHVRNNLFKVNEGVNDAIKK